MPPALISFPEGRSALLTELRRMAPLPEACVGVGLEAIDAALPWRGLPPGLHEIASPGGDGAAIGFASMVAARRPGPVLWCRSHRTRLERGEPYGPGLAAFGLSPDRLILAEAGRPADLLWAVEEAARTRGLAAILGEGVTPDLTAARRLQLAAEAGRSLLLLVFEDIEEAAAASALTRWRVRSMPSRPEAGGPGNPCWELELRRCRGGAWPRSWKVEWDDAALSLALVPALSDRSLAAAAG